MAKKPRKDNATLRNDTDDRVDAMFGGSREYLRSATGRKNQGIPSVDTTGLLVGLPLPALSCRMLFRCDSFPIGRTWELAGEEGSCKTALLSEICRWHAIYGGGGHIAETENKDAATLRNGILQWNERWIRQRVDMSYCDTLEQWQAATTFKLRYLQKQMDDPKLKIGRTIPYMCGVDSLTAVDTQSNVDATMEAGHSKIGFSQIANLVSRYMRQGPATLMREYPFSLVVTNHMKPTQDARGIKQDHVVGGKSLPFASTLRIYMYRVSDIDTQQHGGIRVKMKLQKNSMGASRAMPIECEMIWFRETVPWMPKPVKRFVWDWHSATVEALDRLTATKGKVELGKQLLEICGIRTESKTLRTAYSKVLGIPKSDPQHYRIVAQELEKRPDILEQMYPLLDIEVLPKFKAGVDYREICAAVDTEAAKKAESLYQETTELPEIGPMRDTGRDLNEADDVDAPDGEQEPA
jgi:hypothetical protein